MATINGKEIAKDLLQGRAHPRFRSGAAQDARKNFLLGT